ncbi:hypothetical protein BEN78_01720 [Xanthomonas citri pv. mangiferaeindicae]|nr:hypothetical protein BEN78_01720 [Xanthomonas citri pv. mangiferaeindicae]
MTYVQGFVVAVPTANKNAYAQHARDAFAVLKTYGDVRCVEAWGDEVPRGKCNDFQGAVQATDEETVVFSWMEYPDRATRDQAHEKMMADPRMQQMQDMPFDGKRMILGGFASLVDVGTGRGGYVDGIVLPVPTRARDAYTAMARKTAEAFLEYGAVRVMEAWGDDVPEGKHTDFQRAVLRKDDEQVVFSWIEWPSREVRNAAWPKLMEDPRMRPDGEMPFDGKRMIYGGFALLVEA